MTRFAQWRPWPARFLLLAVLALVLASLGPGPCRTGIGVRQSAASGPAEEPSAGDRGLSPAGCRLTRPPGVAALLNFFAREIPANNIYSQN